MESKEKWWQTRFITKKNGGNHMELLLEIIYWFAEMGATSTSVSKVFDPEVPKILLKEEK